MPLIGQVNAATVPHWPLVLSNMALVQNLTGSHDVISPMWTLPMEMQMYLVLPLCFAATRRGWRPIAGMIAASVVVAMLWSVAPVSSRTIWRLNVLLYVPVFLCGVLAFVLCKVRHTRYRGWLVALPIMILLFGIVILSQHARMPDH